MTWSSVREGRRSLKLLDFAWNMATSLGQRDHESLRLILDENLLHPSLSSDKRGYVIRLPTPHLVEEKFYTLHGLYTDHDSTGWYTVWRLFKASLYHTALHAAYSNFGAYAAWAKGKDVSLATYAVSLVEDMHVTAQAAKRWPGILQDIAYANYISGLRATDPASAGGGPVNEALALLLSVWGIGRGAKGPHENGGRNFKVLASKLHSTINAAITAKPEERKSILVSVAQEVYSSITRDGRLTEIPFLPYVESHGRQSLFDSKLVERPDDKVLMESAYEALGLVRGRDEEAIKQEAADAYAEMKAASDKLASIRAAYEGLGQATRLETVGFPQEDYGMFLRVKAALAGPIRNVKDQVRQIRNVLDETAGHEGGELDTQAAIQVVASKSRRSDVFFRQEPIHKDEAWAILLDASKSISSFSHELKGIATCLSEVASSVVRTPDQWAMFSFNNSFEIMKDFAEDYNITTKARIGALTQRNLTLLPDAMKVVHGALAGTSSEIRIMVVVSDGYPTGYPEIQKKLMETINEISRSGVLLIGVGVDSREIEEYFSIHCVLDSPYQMMKSFVKAYLELSSMF